MDQDEQIEERHGYMLFVEPIIGLLNLFMTFVTGWVIMEILSTDHGRAMAKQLPAIISATFKV